jgi:hypothetical protein
MNKKQEEREEIGLNLRLLIMVNLSDGIHFTTLLKQCLSSGAFAFFSNSLSPTLLLFLSLFTT